jgi:hypothetical protein
MPKYEIRVRHDETYEITAEDEEEARDKAISKSMVDYDYWTVIIEEVVDA